MSLKRFFEDNRLSTLVDVARLRAEINGDKRAYAFVNDDLTITQTLTFEEVDRRARAIAVGLRAALPTSCDGMAPRVMLLFAPGLDYVTAFFGCLYAGAIAVPLYPPRGGRVPEAFLGILADSGASAVLTSRTIATALDGTSVFTGRDLRCLAIEDIPDARAADWRRPVAERLGPDTLAFLQYTSGSTGTPKGVMVSHANLMHNEALIHEAYGARPGDVWFTWLPMYHDMGLIGMIIQPLCAGETTYMASPIGFVHKPLRWLQAIGKFGATISGGPNFAYELCVERVRDEDLPDLNLGSWRIAFNGAEPVLPATLRRFAERFKVCGFRPEAMRPSYGLAENTLFVACSESGSSPRTMLFERAALENNRVVSRPELMAAGAGTTMFAELAGYRGNDGGDVLIVDPVAAQPVAEGEVGEVWVSGRSVAVGYWKKPELTAQTFGARLAEQPARTWLRTGDLGFCLAGDLYVTGRLKDVVIVRGRNYYPQDIELVATQSHGAVRPGGAAAFVDDEGGSEPRLVVAAEIERTAIADLDVDEVCASIRHAVSEQIGLQAHDIALLRPASLPKTSSGKVRRAATKRLWLADELRRLNPTARGLAVTELESEHADERQLARIWRRVFGLAPRDEETTIFSLGCDSIKVVELAQEVERGFGIKMPIHAFYDAPSFGAMIALLRTGSVGRPAVPDLRAEARLPDDLRPAAHAHDLAAARHVLVTGATGFLGAYLLEELLAREGVEVTCLVRAGDDGDALERVRRNLRQYELAAAGSCRLHAVAGDLSQPQLGLDAPSYRRLVEQIDAVYHSAAAVDWAKPYHQLASANVTATIEALRFACQGVAKPFHHISTMWVFPIGKGGDPEHLIDKEDWLPRCEGLETGYNQSKWVAEQLVAQASERGLPTTIHRMDFITAASARGRFKLTDVVPRLVIDAINLGALPETNFRLDLVSVDYLAKMIVSLSYTPKARGKMFHLLNCERLSMASLSRMLGEAGYRVQRMQYEQWRALVTGNKRSALYPLCPLLESYDSEDLAISVTQGADNSQAVAYLDELHPGITQSLPSMQWVIDALLVELREHGLVPEPATAVAEVG